MSERLPQAVTPFSGMTVLIMTGIGLFAFIAIFALLAWSPDLTSKNRAGEHPYSTSALGYNGLVKLLEADGQVVTISRLASSLDYSEGVLVITLPQYGLRRAEDFDVMQVSEPALYVLPKWSGFPDRETPSWQKDTDLIETNRVQDVAQVFDADLKIWRLRDPGAISTPFGTQSPKFDNQMQVIDSDSLEVVINMPGGTLLAKLPGRDIYILSDPDIVNTFGLASRDNARFALSLFDWLRDYPEQPVTLDATVHGFARSESLLRAIFDVPFLGATLIAFSTMLLVIWSAFIRFSPPLIEARSIAFGKRALAESSAGLISMARREGQMAPRYAEVMRRQMSRDLGLPRGLSDQEFADLADRVSKQKKLTTKWTDHKQTLGVAAASRDAVRDKAYALWLWRKEIQNGD